ncbi:hypothetical protein BS50DRAFT_639611 [Corynespora cassiicola Philippines]|uniref:Uncharacterized protein n=1 Tax=Corynespora cassiicola Philippines TaxID=1448308 RepID=A0A2T2N6B5_CORCC|nr:hypothetical protein BS50DRAFT_639611 [Corynespora cassiicola Philippines]
MARRIDHAEAGLDTPAHAHLFGCPSMHLSTLEGAADTGEPGDHSPAETADARWPRRPEPWISPPSISGPLDDHGEIANAIWSRSESTVGADTKRSPRGRRGWKLCTRSSGTTAAPTPIPVAPYTVFLRHVQ